MYNLQMMHESIDMGSSDIKTWYISSKTQLWHFEIYSKLFIDTFPVWIFYALGILNETTKRENAICFLRFLVIYNV